MTPTSRASARRRRQDRLLRRVLVISVVGNIVIGSGLLSGCASVSESMLPDPQTITSDFDGSTEISLDPINASAGPDDSAQAVGFFWTSRQPDEVQALVWVPGIQSISAVSFNADGAIFDLTRSTTVLTQHGAAALDSSTRRFIMRLPQLDQIATAHTVKMKVSSGTSYTVSTFGKGHPRSYISMKLPAFAAAVSTRRQALAQRTP